MQIVFNAGHLAVRGTDVAMYDYAHFAETLLGHRSLVVSPADADNSAYDRFADRFPVTLLDSQDALERLLVDTKADAYYTIDVAFVHDVVASLVDRDPNRYFVFLNTRPFFEHR